MQGQHLDHRLKILHPRKDSRRLPLGRRRNRSAPAVPASGISEEAEPGAPRKQRDLAGKGVPGTGHVHRGQIGPAHLASADRAKSSPLLLFLDRGGGRPTAAAAQAGRLRGKPGRKRNGGKIRWSVGGVPWGMVRDAIVR